MSEPTDINGQHALLVHGKCCIPHKKLSFQYALHVVANMQAEHAHDIEDTVPRGMVQDRRWVPCEVEEVQVI
jgi:hypothetical protein